MSKATRASGALEQAGIAFTVHEYEYDPAAIELAALDQDRVYINGGRRGLQVRLDLKDAQRVLAALAVSLTV